MYLICERGNNTQKGNYVNPKEYLLMGEFHKRLKLLQKNMKDSEFAKLCDLKYTTFRGILEGKVPNFDNAAKIASANNVSLDWLYGAVEAQETFDEEPRKNPLVSSYDPDDHQSVNGFSSEGWKPSISGARPEIDVRLGAGEGMVGEMVAIPNNGGTTGHKVIAEWLLPQEFLVGVMEANASQTVVMEIVGDSMEPTYHSGDRVMVDLGQNRMVADTVYAISDGFSEPQIKRLQRIPFSDPARANIISDNPNLENYEVDLDKIKIIGRICGVIARR